MKAKFKHRQSIDTKLAHVQSHLATGTAPHVTDSLPPSIARHEQSFVAPENIKKKRSPSGLAPMEVESEKKDDGKQKNDEAALSEAADERNDTESLLLEEDNESRNPLGDAAMDAHTELSALTVPHTPSSLPVDPHDGPRAHDLTGANAASVDTSKQVLRNAFVTPSKAPMPHDTRPPGLDPLTDIAPRAPLLLPTDPVQVITNPILRPHGTLPTGFPETRDLSKDVQAGKIPVRGQSRLSKVDILSSSPLVYHDASPLPPPSLLASLSPAPQVLVYGDGHPYNGFLRSFWIADLPSMEWNKLGGLIVLVMLPSFSPFDDEPPFYSHKTIVKQLVSLLRFFRKNGKTTHIWLAYISRSNVADSSFATLLDRRIDLIPTLSFLYLCVMCPILHFAVRVANTNLIVETTSPLDHTLIIMHLTSSPLPKKYVARTVELFPPVAPNEAVSDSIYHPQATLFQLRIDVPSKVVLDYEGSEVIWDITGTLPLMLMLNSLSPDDTSTVLRDILAPRITKEFLPIPVNSCPDGFKPFDFHVPIDVLSRFYQEQDALAEMQVSLGLLHESVKDNALVITHQPRFQKGGPKRKKMPSPEIRDAIEMNSSLRKKLAFVILLNI